MKSGMFEDGNGQKQPEPTRNRGSTGSTAKLPFSSSNTTIYKNLLDPLGNNSRETREHDPDLGEQDIITHEVDSEVNFQIKRNRGSTSSEDQINTSEEVPNIDCENFISDCAREAERGRSSDFPATDRGGPRPVPRLINRGRQMTDEAEGVQTRVVSKPGLSFQLDPLHDSPGAEPQHGGKCANQFDDEYMVIGGHVDPLIQERILNFEYVDFSKLIPRDRVAKFEDTRFELVVRRGGVHLLCSGLRQGCDYYPKFLAVGAGI